MIRAIVLAAGAGRRFGGDKMLALYEDVALVHRAIEAAAAGPAQSIHVVVGDDRVATSVRGAAQTIEAPKDSDGMAASLRAGVKALPPETTAALIYLGDMPLVPPDVAERLVAALDGKIVAAVPTHRGRSGHPVLFARETFPALMALRGDVGAKSVLKALGDRVRYIDVDDPGVLFDVDTPDDLKSD